jgi:hypothetical protein
LNKSIVLASVASISLFLGGCTASISADEASLQLETFGDYVPVGEPFVVGYQLDVLENREGIEYELRIIARSEEGEVVRLFSELGSGSQDSQVTISLQEPGQFELSISIAPEGEGGSWVESGQISVNAVEIADLEAEVSNIPDFWLVDEPYNPEGKLRGISSQDDIRTSLQIKEGEDWVDVPPSDGGRVSIIEKVETRHTLRLQFFSGEYLLTRSDEVEIWFATPQAMVQEFFYEANRLDDEEYYDFWLKHTYPGFLVEEALDKTVYLQEIEEYGRRSTDPLIETVRERPDFILRDDFFDYYPCLESPEPGKVMPGRHFIFDYQTPYSLIIGDTLVGGGLERNSRHITFLDGRAYIYEGHC